MSEVEPQAASAPPDETSVDTRNDQADPGLTIKVIYSVWGADGLDEPLAGGVHSFADPSPELLRSIAGAEAAGVIEVLNAHVHRETLDSHVQSQEDGEAAWQDAFDAGTWHLGSYQQFITQAQDRLANEDLSLTEAERAKIERDIADAEARLAELADEGVTD